DSSMISVNTTTDYTCGDDEEYHLMDEYCYKIFFHETTWQDAKSECERNNAMLLIPQQMKTLNLIKFLFLRRRSYTSSGIAHVGVIYDNRTHTVIQYNTTNGNTLPNTPNPNAIHTLCEKTFRTRYETLMSSSTVSKEDKERLKTQQTGCAYVNFRDDFELSISCNEIPCNQLATVICQKSPIRKTRSIVAKRDNIGLSINDAANFSKPVGKRFSTIFVIFAIIFVLILLGSIYILHKRRSMQENNNRIDTERHTSNLIYSKVSTGNEFDLN
ncbi:unnamed protein product, partial [Rotaria sp. Silwood1]